MRRSSIRFQFFIPVIVHVVLKVVELQEQQTQFTLKE